MADSLRIEKHGIVHVGYLLVVRLASMEEAGHFVGGTWRLLGTQHGWHELGDLGRVVLFVHHIIAHNKIGVALLTYANVVQDFVDVLLTNHFVAGQNESHFEVGHLHLDLINDGLDHCKLVQQGHRSLGFFDLRFLNTLLSIEKTASCVAQLNDVDVLLDAGLDVGAQKSLEEGTVLG